MSNRYTRRTLMKIAAASIPVIGGRAAAAPAPIFDGRTLDGWIQIENNATIIASASFSDFSAFAAKLAAKSDPVSQRLVSRLDDSAKADLAAYHPPGPNEKVPITTILKGLNDAISATPLYDPAAFSAVTLRPETVQLLHKPGRTRQELLRLNKLLLEDAYPAELVKSVSTGWVVKDGAMASTGSGRGVIYTARDYSRFRLILTLRHVSGNPDHQPCVLIFCTRPTPDEKPLDALGGIQFQAPNGGHWDYRPGMNNAGNPFFTSLTKTRFDNHEWSRVEILADAASGTARMAVANPVGSKAIEMLAFKDPAAGKPGPIALQMHNAGLFDEYKDLTVETDPATDELITLR